METTGKKISNIQKREIMTVSNIGFYTLTDERTRLEHSNLERCEMILTEFCNFRCPYCRGVSAYSRDCSGHIDLDVAKDVLSDWIKHGLKNIRFSGGEPTLYPHLIELIEMCRVGGVPLEPCQDCRARRSAVGRVHQEKDPATLRS